MSVRNLSTGGGRDLRILFAEDDVDIGCLVTEMLHAEGFDVTTVENGDQAATTLENEHFHLLLTDVRMPGIKDGIDLAAHACRRYPGLPIVIVSGFASDLGIRLQSLSGKVKFVSKPFAFADLVASIHSALLTVPHSDRQIGDPLM